MILSVKHYVIIDNYIIILYLINVCDGNNYLHSHIRIFKGEQKTFREIYFSEGVRDSFWSYFIPSVARDEMGPKRVENPRGKVNLKVFCSHEKILI